MKFHGFIALRTFYANQGYKCEFCGYMALGYYKEHFKDGDWPALWVETLSGRVCCFKKQCQDDLCRETKTKKRYLKPIVDIISEQSKKRISANHNQAAKIINYEMTPNS